MERSLSLLHRFSNEIASTLVGFSTILIFYYYHNDLFNLDTLLRITWIERSFVVVSMSFILGKSLKYLGQSIVWISTILIHAKDVSKNIRLLISKFDVIKYGDKHIDKLLSSALITTPRIYKYIGEHEYIERSFSEKLSTYGFCMSLLGASIIIPLTVEQLSFYNIEPRLLVLFTLLLAFRSEMQLQTFYVQCAREARDQK